MPFEVNNKHGFVLFDPGFIQEKPVLVIDDNTEEYKKLNEVTKGGKFRISSVCEYVTTR